MTQPFRMSDMSTSSPSPKRISPEDSRALRNALGQFATGVTVIAAQTADGPVGMTANSFSSVSLDPPLVLWSIDKNSTRYDALGAADRFSINVLGAHQGDVACAFAKNGRAFTRNNSVIEDGVPVILDALVQFDCDLHARVDGGDHTIVLGRVRHVTLGCGEPLVFHQGTFGGFVPS